MRYFPFFGILFCLTLGSAQAQDDELMPCKRGEFFGFCDKNDKQVIPAVYHMTLPFLNGLAPVVRDDMQWWMIDRKGILRFNTRLYHDQHPQPPVKGVYTVRYFDPIFAQVVCHYNKHGLPVKVLKPDSIQADTLVYTHFTFEEAALRARARLGWAYGKDSMDCSGFIRYIFSPYGILLPFFAREIAESGREIPRQDLKPGDVVFFEGEKAGTKEINHVGFVLSVKGNEFEFIHASTSKGVVISKSADSYYNKRFLFARRMYG